MARGCISKVLTSRIKLFPNKRFRVKVAELG